MTDAPATRLADPDIRDVGPLLIAGMRQRFTHETRGAIPALWQRLAPHLGHIPNGKPEATFGVVIAPGDGDDNGFDYMAGIGVSSLDELPEELAGLRFPARRYAVFRHDGHVSGLGATCGAIFGSWLPRSGRELAEGPLQLIEYYDSAKFNPRTGLGGLDIWIPLKS